MHKHIQALIFQIAMPFLMLNHHDFSKIFSDAKCGDTLRRLNGTAMYVYNTYTLSVYNT